MVEPDKLFIDGDQVLKHLQNYLRHIFLVPIFKSFLIIIKAVEYCFCQELDYLLCLFYALIAITRYDEY